MSRLDAAAVRERLRVAVQAGGGTRPWSRANGFNAARTHGVMVGYLNLTPAYADRLGLREVREWVEAPAEVR